MKKKNIIGLALLFMCGISLASCEMTTQTNTIVNTVNTTEKETVTIKSTTATNYSSTADLLEDVKSSVVDIYSYSSSGTSAGSGVIVGESDNFYYVITNHHVIDGASTFSVYTYDYDGNQDTYEAELMGGSPKSDIAVLSIEKKENVTLNVASFVEDSDKVRVGEEVVAIGNPLGIYGGTVTKGIISATKREVYLSDVGYMTLMQTDAAINSGNSGGALFNYDGLLVGIVNSGYTSYEGLNFAIPANDAKTAFTSIVNTYHKTGNSLGYVSGEANLGMVLKEATIYSSKDLNSQVSAIYVYGCETGTNSAISSIKSYYSYANGKADTFYAVKSVNGQTFTSYSDMQKYIDSLKAGTEVTFEFEAIKTYRTSGPFGQSVFYLSGETTTVTITLSQYIYSI